MTPARSPELFIEKRAAPRPPDPPGFTKAQRCPLGGINECRPRPGEFVTRCCTRVVFVQAPPTRPPLNVTAPAALQPIEGEADPEEWVDIPRRKS